MLRNSGVVQLDGFAQEVSCFLFSLLEPLVIAVAYCYLRLDSFGLGWSMGIEADELVDRTLSA